MKKLSLALLATLFASHALTSAVSAQAFRYSSPLGAQLTFRQTPILAPGTWYEIQTTNLSSGADTVLAVHKPAGVIAIGGADGCPGDIAPSCARVWLDPAVFTAPSPVNILVRAWSNATSGTGDLRIQQTDNGTETTYGSAACPAGTIGSNCWLIWTSLTFGGFTAGLAATTHLHTETRQMPGAGTTPVQMWAAGDNFNPATNWQMRYIDSIHRSNVAGTREYVGPFPPGALTLIAGPLNTPNPFEVLRNDYGAYGPTTFGTDSDGDGLGATLEHSWLSTCDSTSGPTLGGIACASLAGCSSPSSALCRASLRDSDQDGYEDPLELYGYQSGTGLSPTNLARFGADPATYDVFVEVDVGNQRVSAPAPTCSYTGSAYIDYREATQIVRAYRTATMASFPNRSGAPGIRLHLDIPPTGPLVRSDVAPPANDPSIGSWGGATCVRAPECTTNSQCNFGTDTTGECDPNASASPRYCVRYDALAHGMSSSRRWLFRRMFAFGDAIPTASQVYAFGPGAGQTPALLSYGSPQSAAYHVTASIGYPGGFAHELGHHAGLDHSGPTLSHVLSGFDQNFAPLRYSQMNYGYTGFGFAETPAEGSLPKNATNPTVTISGVALGALPALSFTDLDRVSFASGAASLDPLAAPERAVTPAPFDTQPFNSSGPLAPASAQAWLGAPRWTMSATRDVDWDGRAGLLGAGLTQEAPLYLFDTRVRRQPGPTPSRWTLLYTPSRFVARGTNGWFFRATRSDTGPYMTVSESATAMPCANTPSTAGPRFLPCDFAPGAEATLFLNPGLNTIDPLTFSAASTGGSSVGGAMVVWVDRTTGTLRWGLAQPGQAGALSPHGIISGSPTTTFDGSHVISLARMGGSQNLSLIYRSGAAVVESVLTWSGNTPTWSAPVAIPGLTQVAARSSVGLTTVESCSGLTDGLLMAFRSDSTLQTQVWRRGTSTTPVSGWAFVGNAGIPTGNQLWGAPQLEISRVRRGAAQDWFLNLTVASGDASFYRRSDTNALTFPSVGGESIADFDQNTDRRDLFPTSLTWDPRTGTNAFRGFRGASSTWTHPVECSPLAPCATGQTCTGVGARSLCIAADGFPPGGVSCSSSAVCPTGMTCGPTVSSTSGVCTRTGYVRAEERRHPGADGVIPGRLDVLDDWRMLRQGFCLGMRLQRGLAPVGATIPGTSISYSTPTPSGPEATCAFASY